jgi:hypothetical protein
LPNALWKRFCQKLFYSFYPQESLLVKTISGFIFPRKVIVQKQKSSDNSFKTTFVTYQPTGERFCTVFSTANICSGVFKNTFVGMLKTVLLLGRGGPICHAQLAEGSLKPSLLPIYVLVFFVILL